METIRAAIVDCRSRSHSDEEFIRDLNTLIKDHGEDIIPIIFKVLANIELNSRTAQKYWRDIQSHRLQMMQQMGRHVNLTTAVSDYLQTFTTILRNPCLVDTGTYERSISGTNHDSLTGLYNRTFFDEAFEQQLSLAHRYHTNLSILFLDIDNFKGINDNFGHLAGDNVLQEVASIIRSSIRESDIAVRYGGEEFVLLMPSTAGTDATIMAERIRQRVAEKTFHFNHSAFRLTISGGLASYPQNATNAKDLLFMADSAVYLAKGSGKNTISQFRDEKRRYLRVKIRRPLLIRELDLTRAQASSATSLDIGLGGILLENDTPLPIGSMHEMCIQVDGDENDGLLLIGRVVRNVAAANQRCHVGMSFSFTEMAKEAADQITTFLNSESPRHPIHGDTTPIAH